MERRLHPTVRHRIPRHAHPRNGHRIRNGATLVAFACAVAFGALTIGAPARAEAFAVASTPIPGAIGVMAAVSDGSDGATPSGPVAALVSDSPRPAAPSPVCTALVGAPLAGAPPRAPATPVQAVTPTTRPVAAFLGDSYTTGYNGAGLGRAGWPAIVGASLRLQTANRAVAGTGFVNPGWTAQPIRTRLADVIDADPRIVFLAGGHNDRRFATSLSANAANAVVDRLHRALPNAILVVIGPIWQDGRPPQSLQALRDDLRRKAAAVGAIFIDPLRDPWFGGTARRFIGPDGIHPTDAGHRHVADLVLRALRADPRFTARMGTQPAVAATSTRIPAATAPPAAASPCSP